jgi:hypothetical protein
VSPRTTTLLGLRRQFLDHRLEFGDAVLPRLIPVQQGADEDPDQETVEPAEQKPTILPSRIEPKRGTNGMRTGADDTSIHLGRPVKSTLLWSG